MGMNYYAVKLEPCLDNRVIHIGKSSVGWLFLFHDNDNFHTYPQFKKWLEDNVDTGKYVLLDEYGLKLDTEYLLNEIDRKQKAQCCLDNPNNFKNAKNIDGYRFTEDEFS